MCGKRIFCFLERIVVDLPKCRSDLLGTSTTKRVQYIHYTDHIKKGLKIPCKDPILFTRQYPSWARDNTAATMQQCFQVIAYFYIRCACLLHLDTETWTIFAIFCCPYSSITCTLSRCRCHETNKNCHVPSSGQIHQFVS